MDTSGNFEAWTSLGVSPDITKALIEQNFYTPTTIQALSIPPAILGKRDILGASETGSGKTLAFGIPILNGILKLKRKCGKTIISTSGKFKETNNNESFSEDDSGDDNDNNYDTMEEENLTFANTNGNGLIEIINDVESKEPVKLPKTRNKLYALILTPTRELAMQIKAHLTKAAKYTDIKITVVVGGMAAVKQERILRSGPEIVIATPGRLWELISEGNDHLCQLHSIKYLVIDETDRMLEKGHFLELHDIIERINAKESKLSHRQTFVFSATLTLVHSIPDYLKRKRNKNSKKFHELTPAQKLNKIIEMLKVKNPKVIDVTKGTGTADNITECRISCSIDYKDYYLYYFLKRHQGRTLVFCNSIGCVKRLATLFGILKCKPLPIHAAMPQRQRLKNLERFQDIKDGLLIATDVAARGLDIPNIEHVIHYQVPRTSESYIHRSGRTARAQNEGITVLMMEPSEKLLYNRLCKTLNRTEDLPIFPVIDHLLISVKETVNLAREIDKLELIYRRNNSQKGWLQKAAKEMDILLDDDNQDSDDESKEVAKLKRSLKAKQSQLENMLSKPLFPKNYSGKYLDSSLKFSLEQNSQKAIDVMKQVIEDYPKLKKIKSNTLKKKEIVSKSKFNNNKKKKYKKVK